MTNKKEAKILLELFNLNYKPREIIKQNRSNYRKSAIYKYYQKFLRKEFIIVS